MSPNSALVSKKRCPHSRSQPCLKQPTMQQTSSCHISDSHNSPAQPFVDYTLSAEDRYKCAACREILYDPTTLPCGNTVCRPCLLASISPSALSLYPLHSSTSSLSDGGDRMSVDTDTAPTTAPESSGNTPARPTLPASATVSAYNCPAQRRCTRLHQYRNDKSDVIVKEIVAKVFPLEQYVYGVLQKVQESVKAVSGARSLEMTVDFVLAHHDAVLQEFTRREDSSSCLPDEQPMESPSSSPSSATPTPTASSTSLTPLNPHLTAAYTTLTDLISLTPHLQQTYIVRCQTLALMSRFEEARNDALRALEVNGYSPWVRAALRFVERCEEDANVVRDNNGGMAGDEVEEMVQITSPQSIVLSPPTQSSTRSFRSTTYDCHLCLSTFRDPVTCPCGHTWCRSCLLTTLDHSRACPLCRAALPSYGYFLDRPVNRIISADVEDRKVLGGGSGGESESEGEGEWRGAGDSDKSMLIPIFVCSLVFPGAVQGFHIFEPRYRVSNFM